LFLYSSFNFTGFDTAGANIAPPGGTVQHDFNALYIWAPPSQGFNVRVAYLVTGNFALIANYTYFSHFTTLPALFSHELYFSTNG
jgi:hypothetical protein